MRRKVIIAVMNGSIAVLFGLFYAILDGNIFEMRVIVTACFLLLLLLETLMMFFAKKEILIVKIFVALWVANRLYRALPSMLIMTRYFTYAAAVWWGAIVLLTLVKTIYILIKPRSVSIRAQSV